MVETYYVGVTDNPAKNKFYQNTNWITKLFIVIDKFYL